MSGHHAQRLGRLYADWRDDAIPAAALATARMGILDVAGCIVGGAPTPTATKVRRLAAGLGAGDGASILGTGDRMAPPLAALANGAAGHVLDYDDMSSTSITHPSVVLVPAIFAVAEPLGRSGRDVLSAYVLGFEVGAHFGRAMIPRHYDSGWHATSTIGVLAAAAAAARLLGLDAAGALNAIAIAASSAAGLRANFGSMTKSLHAGQAAESGVRAAFLSLDGFTANAGVFDARGGFLDVYGAADAPRPEPPLLEIEASGIGIKPYACCGAGVSVIDAALDLREAHALRGADIASVSAIVSGMAASIMPFHEAKDGLQAKYCLEYCAAVALLDGAGGMAQFEDERARRGDVRDLVRRTRVASDPRMASGAGRFGVELAVTLADGRTVSTSLELPRGHPRRPLPEERLVEKFVEIAGPVLGAAPAREAAEILQGLEGALDIRAVIARLCKR